VEGPAVEGRVRDAAFGVVVVDIDAQDALELAAVEDQQPVETLMADGSDKALGDHVCPRRPHRRAHGPDLFAAKDVVERVPDASAAACAV
jgi:hypothetical protein